MDASRFDSFLRRWATRRRAIGGLLLGSLGAAGALPGEGLAKRKKKKKKKKKNNDTPTPAGCPNGCAFNERCAGNQCVPFCISGTSPCNAACCLDGAETCQNGVCVQLCADRRPPCGGACCGDGVACVDGACGPNCPVDQEPCAGRCCAAGTICVEEVCIPPCLPPGHLCGSVCCQEGEVCTIERQCAAACTGEDCPHYVLDASWGISGLTGGALDEPCGVALDDDSNLYVLDCGNDRVIKVNAAGVVQAQWTASGYGLTVANSRVYVANGGVVSKFTTAGVADGFMTGVSGANDVSADLDGNIYVLGNSVITVFDAAGLEIDEWTAQPPARPFSFPVGIAIDQEAGDVVVANTGRHLVQKFDPDGILDMEWGGFATCGGAGQTSCEDQLNQKKYSSPAGVAVDPEGNIYVADFGNDRVLVYQERSAYITQFGRGELDGPDSLAVDDERSVFVADSRHDRVVKYRLVSMRQRAAKGAAHRDNQGASRSRRKQRKGRQRREHRRR